MIVPLLIFGAFGHAILWVAMVSRWHGTAIPQPLREGGTFVFLLAAIVIPLPVAWSTLHPWWGTPPADSSAWWSAVAWVYLAACTMICIVATIHWYWLRFHPERRGALLSNHTIRHDPRDRTSGPLTSTGIPMFLSRLPGNQVLEIHLHEKELRIPRLTLVHDGLRIAHLSDLHMSGRIAKVYFEEVVEHVNQAQPDLIAITGDLVEHNKCIDWIPDTLGRLRAPAGVVYVLGNHDRRVDYQRLTGALAEAGLIHLGGRRHEATLRGAPLLLAGNELPWFGPATDLQRIPTGGEAGIPLRILLAHSPDQFRWARERGVDLMLAGHNHGGQVCLPAIGPIVAPSLHGVRYAAGVFLAGNTVLHVSRGTSSLSPLRFNCP
ncbi:MAG: metallophosphoesterase, partial [Planctomycetes bacterium]|nr:metallophosphoesterase [Planctomycetota bacterium]